VAVPPSVPMTARRMAPPETAARRVRLARLVVAPPVYVTEDVCASRSRTVPPAVTSRLVVTVRTVSIPTGRQYESRPFTEASGRFARLQEGRDRSARAPPWARGNALRTATASLAEMVAVLPRTVRSPTAPRRAPTTGARATLTVPLTSHANVEIPQRARALTSV